MHDICFVNLPRSAAARLRKVSLQLPHLSVFSLIKRVFRDALIYYITNQRKVKSDVNYCILLCMCEVKKFGRIISAPTQKSYHQITNGTLKIKTPDSQDIGGKTLLNYSAALSFLAS